MPKRPDPSSKEEGYVTAVTRSDVTLPAWATLLAAMDEDPYVTWTLRDVARFLNRSKTAVKMGLSRYAKVGRIVRMSTGLYQSPKGLARPGPPPVGLRIHGLKVEGCYQMVGRPFLAMSQRVTTIWPSPTLHVHSRNHSVTTSADWEGRWLTATVHRETSGLVEVFLQASTRPLNLLELHSYLMMLTTVLGIPAELLIVRQADWNIDLPGVSIKEDLGLTGLSVAGFERLIVKVYQKADDLARVEARSFEAAPADTLLAYLKATLSAMAEVYRKRPEP